MEEFKQRFTDLYYSFDIEEFQQLINGATSFKRIRRQRKYTNLLAALTLQWRDISEGKGEYGIAYQMIIEWYSLGHYDIANKLLYAFFNIVGSWKDAKYIWFHAMNSDRLTNEQKNYIEQTIVLFIIQTLSDDIENYPNSLSLVAKWIPREHATRFKRLFYAIVSAFYNINYTPSNKHKRNFRQMISQLNKTLDTTQIKMCANEWSAIDFNNVTAKTLYNNREAFRMKCDNYIEITHPPLDDWEYIGTRERCSFKEIYTLLTIPRYLQILTENENENEIATATATATATAIEN